MQVTREDISPCLASLEIQIEPGQYAASLTKARAELGSRTEVPGFRRGKAPMHVLERYLDPERVTNLANDHAMADALEEVFKEQETDLWDDPSVEVLECSPESGLKFKALLQFPPKVELGQYVGLDVERVARPVTDDLIDGEIDRLLREHTTLEPKEDAVEDGDYVFVGIQELDDEGAPQGDQGHNAAVIGENVPDFDANITGMKAGETKRFDISYPEDWADTERAGKTTHVDVSVTQAYRQVRPELTDEFVKTLGDYESVEALRSEIASSAARAFAQLADDQVENDILRQIVEGSQVHYPPQLHQRETARRAREILHDLEHRGRTFQQYLEDLQMTEEQFREMLQRRADNEIRVGLVLGEIADKENIEVSEEEIDEQIERFRSAQAEPSEDMMDFVQSPDARSMFARRRRTAKTLEFLRAASNITEVTRAPEEAAGGSDSEGEDKEA
jgi:trigger factor